MTRPARPTAALGTLLLALACLSPAQAQTAMTKCVGGGRTSYVQTGRCPPGQRPVDVNLPALSSMDAATMVPGRTHKAPPAPPARPAGTGQQAGPAKAARPAPCASLARQIEAIDAQSRQPQSGATQDSLRERRRGLRRRQSEWGC